MKRKGKKITMITAYDYPSARHANYADFDIILVGDSVGMVCLGYDSTLPVTMEDMVSFLFYIVHLLSFSAHNQNLSLLICVSVDTPL